jgi:SAM-dependent methyltransferase
MLFKTLDPKDYAAGASRRPGLGDLWSARPISRSFGFDRGAPVDRHFVDRFLTTYVSDVFGRTLEIGDDSYTARYGGTRTTHRDILHVDASNPRATIVGDLAGAAELPADAFHCAVITQTLHLIQDVRSALVTLHRSLRPGGVLLATVPGVSQISQDEWAATWYWGFTARSLRRLAESVFGADAVVVEPFGSPAATVAFLHGVAAEEVPPAVLAVQDPARPTLLGLRAVRT